MTRGAGPLRASPLRPPVRDCFFRQPQPVVRLPLSSPSTSLRSSSGMLHCAWPVRRYQHPRQPSLRPHRSKSAVKVGPRHFVFHQHFFWVSGHHLSGSHHSNLDVERTVTAIWGPWNRSHSEYSVRVPSLRLKDSLDVHLSVSSSPALAR